MPVLTEKMFTNVKVVCTTGTVMDTTDSIVHTTNRNNVKMKVSLWNAKYQYLGEQGWRSGESACLPPMWPGFKSRRPRHMWVEFVVGSPLAPRGFSPGTPVFPSPQKPTFPNSNSTRNQVDKEPLCGCATCKSLFIYYLFIYIKRRRMKDQQQMMPNKG